jgi:hypothetical protein
VFLGSSGCFWKVPGVFGKFPGCFGKFRHVFEVPGCFRKFKKVLESFRSLRMSRYLIGDLMIVLIVTVHN